MSNITERPSDKRLVTMAYAMATTGNVDVSHLSDSDARLVWRIIWAVIQWRRDLGIGQPTPKKEMKGDLSKGNMRAIARRLGEDDPDSIVAEILQEPLLQAAFSMLAACMACPVPMPFLSVSIPGGESGL